MNWYVSYTKKRQYCLNKVLSINFGDKDVSKSVPWHVAESCDTVVNMNLDASRSHLTVNICAWVLSKSYVVFSVTKEDPYQKENIDHNFRIIKTIYECKNTGDPRKTITMHYAAAKSATDTRLSRKQKKYAIISCKFESEGLMIELSKQSIIHPSVRKELKRKVRQGNPPKELLIKYWKKKWKN